MNTEEEEEEERSSLTQNNHMNERRNQIFSGFHLFNRKDQRKFDY